MTLPTYNDLKAAHKAGTLHAMLASLTPAERIDCYEVIALQTGKSVAEVQRRIERQADTFTPTPVPMAALADACVAAEQATDDPRWRKAIDTAYAWLIEQDTVLYSAATHALRVESATERGKVYEANGACSCRAFEHGNACWHRSAARLFRRALELEAKWAASVAA